MKAEAEIAKLDRMLAAHGTDMLLIRGNAAGSPRVTVRAKPSGFTPRELVGDIAQQDSVLIISPTQIEAASWPGAGQGESLPQKGDRIRDHGANKMVLAATAKRVGDRIIRIEIMVRGMPS